MMKLILASVLLVAVAMADHVKVCEVRNGKNVLTFAGTPERAKFPCKYNMVRHTKCGKWRITLTPGNDIESEKMKRYVIKTVYLGIENTENGLKWEGRTDLKVARKYLDNLKEAPFNQLDGYLKTAKVFRFGDRNADNEVSVKEKGGDFKVTFGLYEPNGDWHRASTLKFECYADTFEPSAYPKQVCGNGTSNEIRDWKRAMEWRDDRRIATFHNVFTNMDIVQTDSDCLTAARTLSNKCGDTQSQYNAIKLCYPILGKQHVKNCISKMMDKPISAYRHCVEFVCSGYKDLNACYALGDELDMCPIVPEVSLKVRSQCMPDLFCT